MLYPYLQPVHAMKCMHCKCILLQAAGKRSYTAEYLGRQSTHKLQATSECSTGVAWSTAHCNILRFPWTLHWTGIRRCCLRVTSQCAHGYLEALHP